MKIEEKLLLSLAIKYFLIAKLKKNKKFFNEDWSNFYYVK